MNKNIMHFIRSKNFWRSSQLNDTREKSLLHFHGNTVSLQNLLEQWATYVSNYIHLNRHKKSGFVNREMNGNSQQKL